MQIICIYFLLFLMYSFLGWFMEVSLSFWKQKRFINRGFLIGPYCPIYGYGSLLIILLLNRYKEDPILLFCMAIIICSLLEYITSYVLEKIFHARWWDYSDKRFNLNGRICLETMIPFGLLGLIIVYLINPFFQNILMSIPTTMIYLLAILLCLLFLIDNILSFRIMASFKQEFKKAERDNTEAISKKVREKLIEKGYFYKRLLLSFPHIKNTHERLLNLKENIEKKLNEKNKNKKLKSFHTTNGDKNGRKRNNNKTSSKRRDGSSRNRKY